MSKIFKTRYLFIRMTWLLKGPFEFSSSLLFDLTDARFDWVKNATSSDTQISEVINTAIFGNTLMTIEISVTHSSQNNETVRAWLLSVILDDRVMAGSIIAQ